MDLRKSETRAIDLEFFCVKARGRAGTMDNHLVRKHRKKEKGAEKEPGEHFYSGVQRWQKSQWAALSSQRKGRSSRVQGQETQDCSQFQGQSLGLGCGLVC